MWRWKWRTRWPAITYSPEEGGQANVQLGFIGKGGVCISVPLRVTDGELIDALVVMDIDAGGRIVGIEFPEDAESVLPREAIRSAKRP